MTDYPSVKIIIRYQIIELWLSDIIRYNLISDNPLIRIYINKIGNRIIFKIKAGYYLELLIPDTMKLFRSIEKKDNQR